MKKLIIICSLVLSFGILAPGQLSAIPLQEDEIVSAKYIGRSSGDWQSWGSLGELGASSYWTGTINFEIKGVVFEAFCVEDTRIETGFLDYTVNPVKNLGPEYEMAAFYASNYYDNYSQNDLWAALTQAFIWETVLETDFTDGLYDLADGNVELVNTLRDPAVYNEIMSNIGERDPGNLTVFLAGEGFDSTGWFVLQNKDSQDFLVPAKPVPVPEPGMIILLGIGLIGLAIYSRRRLVN